METTSFRCGFASSFLGAEKPSALKTTISSPLSFCWLASVPTSRQVEACAVSNKPTGKPRGIIRPRKVSTVMIGVPEISRTEALKLICAHIKQNNLQIFVGGIDQNVSDDQLRQVFRHFGELVNVKIPIGKHCGFVQFAIKKDLPLG